MIQQKDKLSVYEYKKALKIIDTRNPSSIHKDNALDDAYKSALATLDDLKNSDVSPFLGDTKFLMWMLFIGIHKGDDLNLYKGIEDAFNKVLYIDDRQNVIFSLPCPWEHPWNNSIDSKSLKIWIPGIQVPCTRITNSMMRTSRQWKRYAISKCRAALCCLEPMELYFEPHGLADWMIPIKRVTQFYTKELRTHLITYYTQTINKTTSLDCLSPGKPPGVWVTIKEV
jgi:hypothetical protein